MGYDKKIFPQRLRQLRTEAGLVGADLAARLGVHRTAVVNMERGVSGPSVDVLHDLAVHFGVSADFLIGLTDRGRSKNTPGPAPRPSKWLLDILPELESLDKQGREAVKALVRGMGKAAPGK